MDGRVDLVWLTWTGVFLFEFYLSWIWYSCIWLLWLDFHPVLDQTVSDHEFSIFFWLVSFCLLALLALATKTVYWIAFVLCWGNNEIELYHMFIFGCPCFLFFFYTVGKCLSICVWVEKAIIQGNADLVLKNGQRQMLNRL